MSTIEARERVVSEFQMFSGRLKGLGGAALIYLIIVFYLL